jgi:hypothetical protein
MPVINPTAMSSFIRRMPATTMVLVLYVVIIAFAAVAYGATQ